MTTPAEAFENDAQAAFEGRFAMEEFARQFHPELVARHIPRSC